MAPAGCRAGLPLASDSTILAYDSRTFCPGSARRLLSTGALLGRPVFLTISGLRWLTTPRKKIKINFVALRLLAMRDHNKDKDLQVRADVLRRSSLAEAIHEPISCPRN